jgi:hypothetical protein
VITRTAVPFVAALWAALASLIASPSIAAGASDPLLVCAITGATGFTSLTTSITKYHVRGTRLVVPDVIGIGNSDGDLVYDILQNSEFGLIAVQTILGMVIGPEGPHPASEAIIFIFNRKTSLVAIHTVDATSGSTDFTGKCSEIRP